MKGNGNAMGTRMRHRRTMMGMRLADLAKEVGCSESMISKIEHGKANPSLKMLHQIARALDMSASALFSDADDEQFVGRQGSRPLMNVSTLRSGTDVFLEVLVPFAPDRLLQSNIHIIHPGGHTDGEYWHEGEDMGYVLEGELELSLEGETYHLKAGDSFFFRSELKHCYRNPGHEVAKVLWVNTPPSF